MTHADGDLALARPSMTLGEAVGVTAVATVALLGTVSLALAQSGHHDGVLAIAITAALLVPAGLVAARHRPRITIDRVELGLLAGVVLLTGFFFLPGATYAYVDKDPGVYAAHAFAIARGGDVDVEDPVLAAGLDPPGYSGGRFPGIWRPDSGAGDAVTSQFYALQSALLATGHDVGGKLGVFQATPVLAMASVALVLLALRRTAGTLPAALAAAVLTTCMLQVWQAKVPGSETLAQLLLVGAGLAIVIAIEERWWVPAAVSGTLLGVGFLVRPDGFLYVVIGAMAAGVVIASGRLTRAVVAFVVGLLVPLPYAFWNAYVERETYTASNSVPTAGKLAALLLGPLAIALVVHAIRRRSAPLAVPRAWQRRLGVVGTIAAAGAFLVLWYRESLFGADFSVRAGERFATLDEDALHWFSWFLTVPGIVAVVAGVGVLVIRRWQASLFALVVPGALLLPVYLWDPRIANRLMWWGRRFVPAALPAAAMLIGLAVGWAVLQRRWVVLRAVGALTGAFVLAVGVGQSLDLYGHREMGGSWIMGTEVASNGTPDGSLFLFARPTSSDVIQPARNLPAALALIHDRATSILADPPSMAEIEGYRAAMPGRDVLLVAPGDELPEGLPAERFERRDTVEQPISFWEESSVERPDVPRSLLYTLSVWALRTP